MMWPFKKKKWIYAGIITRRYKDTDNPYLTVKAFVNEDDIFDRKIEFVWKDPYLHRDWQSDQGVCLWKAGATWPSDALEFLTADFEEFLKGVGIVRMDGEGFGVYPSSKYHGRLMRGGNKASKVTEVTSHENVVVVNFPRKT